MSETTTNPSQIDIDQGRLTPANRTPVLGNPFVQPRTDLAAIAGHFAMQEFLFGAYYLCRGTKSPCADNAIAEVPRLVAAE